MRDREDQYFPPGTRVRFDGLVESGHECGVVIHCWMNPEIGNMFDCYVAFFGSEFPNGSPSKKPYVLRYAAASLIKVED